MSLKNKLKKTAPFVAGVAVGIALGLITPEEKSESTHAGKVPHSKVEKIDAVPGIQAVKENMGFMKHADVSQSENDLHVAPEGEVSAVPPPDENLDAKGHNLDAHVLWRGQFYDARNSGKISDAHSISSYYGWLIPIPESSPLWELNINSPEFQKEYNKLNKIQRSYYNGYLSFLSEGLGHLARMWSATAAHKSTVEVTAWMQGRYLSVVENMLSADFPLGRGVREKLSQETCFRIADFQMMTKADQMLQSVMAAYQTMRDEGINPYETMLAAYDASVILQDPVSGKAFLSQRIPHSENIGKRHMHKRHEGHGGAGR